MNELIKLAIENATELGEAYIRFKYFYTICEVITICTVCGLGGHALFRFLSKAIDKT